MYLSAYDLIRMSNESEDFQGNENIGIIFFIVQKTLQTGANGQGARCGAFVFVRFIGQVAKVGGFRWMIAAIYEDRF